MRADDDQIVEGDLEGGIARPGPPQRFLDESAQWKNGSVSCPDLSGQILWGLPYGANDLCCRIFLKRLALNQ